MFALGMITLAVALAASVWTTAYAWTATLPELLWLQRVRSEDAWLDTIEAMHHTLACLETSGAPGAGDNWRRSA